MTITRKVRVLVLVVVTLICVSFLVSVNQAKEQEAAAAYADSVGQEETGNALASFIADKNDELQEGQEATLSEGVLNERGRLSQRVTIFDDSGTLPISGTITKNQDAFYPGTYELKFSTNAILNKPATIQVKMDVAEGEHVYILTGDKEKGYNQIAVVTADANKEVSFSTQVLKDYTISTTDIVGAQAAMASYTGK